MKWQEYFEYWDHHQKNMRELFTEEGRYQAFRDRLKEELLDEERRRARGDSVVG